MNLVAIAGKVSHINRIASTEDDGGRITTTHETTLRVDGRHVQIGDACNWLSDGDHVAIVGHESGGELVPVAIRNDTTGYENIAEVRSSYGFGILMIVLGVILFALIIGIFMIGWGIWTIFRVNRDKKIISEATRRLHSIPRVVAAATAP